MPFNLPRSKTHLLSGLDFAKHTLVILEVHKNQGKVAQKQGQDCWLNDTWNLVLD